MSGRGGTNGHQATGGERVYRLLLRLYPEAFRRRFGGSMVEAFHARRDATLRAGGGATRFWSQILRDLLRSLPGAWRPSRFNPAGAPPKRRRARHLALPSALLCDLDAAAKRVRRQPVFTGVVVLITGVGISAATVVFSVVNGVILEPLPYFEPERIVRLWANLPEEGIEDFSFTKVEFRHFHDHNRVFESIGGDFPLAVTITGDGEPERVRAAYVTPGYFETFAVRPALGRFIEFRDIDQDNLDIAVISHRLWQRRLGGRADAVGSVLIVNDRGMEVVGILPADYHHLDDDYDIYIPYTRGTSGWIGRWVGLSARLAEGVGVEQAQANLDAMMATLAEQEERSRDWSVSLEPVGEWAVGGTRAMLIALSGAVGLVLLLTCVNVANLLVARATTRTRETAIRLALGAGRGRLVGQDVAEAMVIVGLGGAVGVLLAYGSLPLVLQAGSSALPRLAEVAIDTRVLVAAVLVTGACGLLCGGVPAWYGARTARGRGALPRPVGVAGERGTHRLRGVFVAAEVALALAVLIGAGLFLRSFQRLQAVDIGIRADGVVAASISLPAARYADAAAVQAFFDELLARTAALPGVESVSLSAYLPLDGEGAVTSLTHAGRLDRGVRERVATLQRVVRKDFFATMGMPIVRGRDFDERVPSAEAGQLIISQSLADAFWPGEDPLGKRVTASAEPDDDDWYEVIGVVADIRYVDLESPLQPQMYESHLVRWWRDAWVVTRTSLPPDAYGAELRRMVREIDPQVPVADLRTMTDLARRAVAGPRFSAAVLGGFALSALLLACAGIYGMVAFAVGRRSREIGIRKALGASQAAVVRRTLLQGMAPVAAGLALGTALSSALSGVLAGTLFGTSPLDPTAYAAAVVLLAAVALLACWLPARRTAGIDARVAMRDD
jgi:predicted permease